MGTYGADSVGTENGFVYSSATNTGRLTYVRHCNNIHVSHPYTSYIGLSFDDGYAP